MLLVRFFVWCALLPVAGCGLSGAGLGPDLKNGDTDGGSDVGAMPWDAEGGIAADAGGPFDAGAWDEATTNEATSDDAAFDDTLSQTDGVAMDGTAGDTAIVGMDSASCRSAIPSGWSLVVYDVSASTCPAGFAAHAVRATPVIAAGACPCTCTVGQSGSCMQGNLSTWAGRGNGNMCAMPWLSVAVAGSSCTAVSSPSGPPPRTFQASPLQGQGGTCSDAVQPDATKLSAPVALYCDVPATKGDSVCDGAAPAGFASCIATSGATTCPPGTPFTQRHVVEDGAALQCSACAGCSVATTCTNAVLTTFADPFCGGPGTPLTVDGTCTSVGWQGVFSVSAVTYTAAASSTCTSGTSTPDAQLANPQTLCCR